MKLLTYLTVIVKDIQPSDECKLSVPWMVRMVQKMINYEVVTAPSSTIVVSSDSDIIFIVISNV